MQHAILGPGGVGGLVGAVLARSGESVTLVVRPGTAQLYPHTLILERPCGALSASVTIDAVLTRPVDCLWIAVKSMDLSAALQSIPDPLQCRTVVPLLNGIDHLAFLRERFRDVLAATIAVEAERVAPGRIVQRSPFVLLRMSAAGRGPLAGVMEHFERFGFQCSFVEDEAALMWRKLVFLAPFALCTTTTGSTIGEIVSNPDRMPFLRAMVAEACAVASASGSAVDPDQILRMIISLPADMRSSMQKDAERGRPLELDAIAGPILRAAKLHGVGVPAIDWAVRQINSTACCPRN